jgi:hypothetical protein
MDCRAKPGNDAEQTHEINSVARMHWGASWRVG